MSSGSKIVKASIGPMEAKNIRFPISLLQEVEVDVKHPITQALMQQLPRLDDVGLKALRAHMETHDGLVNSTSRKEDVESWIALVDREISYRQREQKETLASLLSFLSTSLSKGIS